MTASFVVKYINSSKVPHLFLSVNGDKKGYARFGNIIEGADL